MGRIQANTGIISGIPITETVKQLMQIEARPRDLLKSRASTLEKQQVAITELTATVIAVQLAARNLAKASVFDFKNVESSNKSLLTATANGTPAEGTYRFAPVRQATSQQLLSTGFATKTEPIGAGEFTLQYGGYLDEGVALDELNGGNGVQRGKIRITDRSGASAVVDLRFAQTIDDVLHAINTTDSIQVTAVADGDRLRLIDRSGGTTSNLKVQEVNGGSTASDLGLASINVAASEATGKDISKLYAGMSLDRLNDGNGLSIRSELADLNVTFRDGTSLALDFRRKLRPENFATATTTGDPDAQITLTAKTKGADLDGVRLQFVDDPGVTAGSETVVYDDSDPGNKTLTVHIDAGATTADQVIAAITGDATVGALFTAARATGSNGTGLVTVNDTAVTSGGAALEARNEQTLGQLLQTINEADPTRLKAELSADGDRIVLTDLTNDLGGTFEVTSTAGGTLAEDLGLTGTAVGGTLTSERIHSGLKTTLLRTLGGGDGLGTLGSIEITDRSGASAVVDLSGAETLDDILTAINDAGLGIEARVNAARNGLEIVDTTGAVSNNLKIASNDATDTAAKLQIAIDDATDKVNSGNLNRQIISENTLLSSLNGGQGIARTSFFVNDSNGATAVVQLDKDSIQTIGDVLDAINALSIGVEARLNATGDGIDIIDTAGGSNLPSVRDIGNGTATKDLHLTDGKEITVDGETRKVVQGSFRLRVEVSETDTLEDVVTKIKELGGGFTASILSDGSGQTPHRLSIQSTIVGKQGSLLVDSTYGVRFEELTRAQDALLQLGAGGDGAGVLVTSKSNTFENVVAGINVTIVDESTEAVTVTVSQSDSSLVSTAQQFVDQYNKLRDKLKSLTFYNETDKTTGVLFGTMEALRIDTESASLLSGRFFGVGDIQSLKEVGLDLKDDGQLTLDAEKLKAKFASDPAAVKAFFTAEKRGFAAKVDDLMEDFAGINNSLLVSKTRSLIDRIAIYNDRIANWDVRLTRKQESLLKKFYNLETTLGKLQTNMNAIAAIQYIPPVATYQQ